MTSPIIKPKALPKNGTIGIVSPSSPMRDPSKLHAGIAYLESLGYRVELAPHVGKADAYLAGSDEDRAADLQAMFANPKIDAIFCTRGGYGAMRFLSLLDYKRIARTPKILVGFSDVTALNAALCQRSRLLSFSGAMVGVDMPAFDTESEEQFWRIITSKKKIGIVRQSLQTQCLRPGVASGALVCGNLSILAALQGSRYAPLTKGTLLLCEDIGEESYRIDRLLCQMELSGALAASTAVLFGQFTMDAKRESATATRPVLEVLQEYADRAAKPAVANIMYGHTAKKLTLPFGLTMQINTRTGVLRCGEAAVV
jgi:muramoyltetrapeptide carboxypeptidase